MRWIILLLFSLPFVLYSQDTLSVGVYSIGQRSFLYNRAEAPGNNFLELSSGFVKTIQKVPTYNHGFGIIFKRRVFPRTLVCYGFQYIPVEQSYKLISAEDIVYPGRIRLRYLSGPLLIQYNYIQRQKFSAYFSAGPQLSMLVFETGAIPYYYFNLDLVDAGSAYHNFTFDGIGLAGCTFKLSNKLSLDLLSRFLFGFTNPENRNYIDAYATGSRYLFKPLDNSTRPATHTILIGAGFGINYILR
jgi:hypothetical protein